MHEQPPHERPDRPGHSPVVFEPTRPVTRRRLVLAFLLGALVWLAAGVLAVVLLGHSYILRTLLTAVAVSWLVFALALFAAIALRHRQERRPPPPAPAGPSPEEAP